jgi:hypothetical protein
MKRPRHTRFHDPGNPATGNPHGHNHGIIAKFLKLAGAQWVRDSLHTLFLIVWPA